MRPSEPSTRPAASPVPWTPALLVAAALVAATPARAEIEATECLFEFNKAYSWSEAGLEQLRTAQSRVAEGHTDSAAEHYRRSVDLLQKSIEHYRDLPELAFDCSAANLSIARNNLRIARDNVQHAQEEFAGLDCLKALDELESLSSLASEYYHRHRDPASARQSAADALALADAIEHDGLCTGDYAADLAARRDYARQIADALETRGRYDRCMELVKQAAADYDRARQSAGANRAAWQQVVQTADQALQSGACDEPYRKELQTVRSRALEKLK